MQRSVCLLTFRASCRPPFEILFLFVPSGALLDSSVDAYLSLLDLLFTDLNRMYSSPVI